MARAATCFSGPAPRGSRPVEFGRRVRGIETRDIDKARRLSLSGTGAVTSVRERPVDPARIIPASEFVPMGLRFLGTEEPLAARCPRCEATDVNTRHARTCHRAGAQANQHQPLVHALSRTFKRLFIRHQVESRALFNADRNFRIDKVIERRALRDAMLSEYCNKAIPLDARHAETPRRGPHAGWQC